MTREDVEKMEAGREMDRLIAERIFNLEVFEQEVGTEFIHTKDPCHSFYPCGDTSLPIVTERIAFYSTNIAAAWQVVEKLRKDKHEVSMQSHDPHLFGDNLKWCCKIDPIHDYSEWEAWANTAPLSICRAALISAL